MWQNPEAACLKTASMCTVDRRTVKPRSPFPTLLMTGKLYILDTGQIRDSVLLKITPVDVFAWGSRETTEFFFCIVRDSWTVSSRVVQQPNCPQYAPFDRGTTKFFFLFASDRHSCSALGERWQEPCG
jgi:hypothetical protein